MKSNIFKLMSLVCLLYGGMMLTACDDDDWGNDNAEKMNEFFFGFQDWGTLKNDVTFSVNQGGTIEIPVQFWCSGTRSFDAESFYYVDSKLALGTDYQIADANGNPLSQNERGAFVMKWNLTSPDATNNHRVQNIYFKALNGAKGDVTLMTFDPKDVDDAGKIKISNAYTPNNITGQYEVHAFTQNYKVKVTIK
ncbi:MAG: hypothetical protein J6Y23_09945 [Prevotella sp.]|nr:hypothetical protein [Prevotella sp.]